MPGQPEQKLPIVEHPETQRHRMPKRMHDWIYPPKFCHSCDYYGNDGVCQIFGMVPPEDFAATEDACDRWRLGVPF